MVTVVVAPLQEILPVDDVTVSGAGSVSVIIIEVAQLFASVTVKV